MIKKLIGNCIFESLEVSLDGMEQCVRIQYIMVCINGKKMFPSRNLVSRLEALI